MTTTPLTLDEINTLAMTCLIGNGADEMNATALANTITNAERDGSHSHGLFRLPAYVSSLRAGTVNGVARPIPDCVTPAMVKIDGDNGYASTAHQIGIPLLLEAAKKCGVGVLAIRQIHHMAALWPEVETIAEHNLVGLACTASTPVPCVAPAGATKALFGTNPISFAWPRPGTTPVVFDMATAAMALGDVQIAARDGHDVPPGTGLDADGNATTDPGEITDGGVLLPFGGYKGSAISMMVELLAAGLVNEHFSFEAKEGDNGDGGSRHCGQFILALSPEMIAGSDWANHCDAYFQRMSGMAGVRMPGERRHKNRQSNAPRNINTTLLEKIHSLLNN